MPPPWALGAALEGAAAPGGWCPVAGGATLAATGAGVATTVAAEGMGRGRPASWVAPALEARADHEERSAPAAPPPPPPPLPWQARGERRGDEGVALLTQVQSMSQESATLSSPKLFEPL